jgi:hypothetical protein
MLSTLLCLALLLLLLVLQLFCYYFLVYASTVLTALRRTHAVASALQLVVIMSQVQRALLFAAALKPLVETTTYVQSSEAYLHLRLR